MICFPTSKRLKTVAALALAAVALVLPFCLIPYGFWPVDEPYQILLSIDHTANPVAFLSSYVIGLWGNAFGFELTIMRTFAAILSSATVAIAGVVLYRRTRRPLLSVAIASIANILLTFNQSQSYTIGWDVVSNFVIMVSLAALLAVVRATGRRAIAWAAVLGCLTAFAVGARLPNVAIAPIIAIMLLVRRRGRETAVFAVSAIATASALVVALYGNFGSFTDSISDYASQQIAAEHNARQLLAAIVIAARRILPFAAAFFAILAVGVIAERKKWTIAMWCAFGLIPIAIFGQYHWAFNTDNQMISDIFAVPVAGLIVLSLMSNYDKNRSHKAWFFIVILSFFILPNIGSNAFWSKFLSAQILPIAMIPFVLKPMSTVRRMLLFVGGTLLVGLPLYKYDDATWLDKGVSKCGYKLYLPQMENIHTSENRFRRLSDIYELTKDDDALIVGDGWQTFAYSSGNYDRRLLQFFGVINGTLLDDHSYVDAIREKIDSDDTEKVVVIDPILCRHNTTTLLTRMLIQSGYSLTDSGSAYAVYEKSREELTEL